MRKTVQKLLFWYKENKRTLPWRDTGDAYKVLLSEIMLQQTRIEAVKKYFNRFIQTLPDIASLAGCEETLLMKLWEGLGYYSRAKNLKKTAEKIVEKGYFPETKEELLTLPGIGEYTSGAISSIAFGKRACAIDGNVIRILSRLHGKDVTKREAEKFLMKYMPEEGEECSHYTQSWMELGERLCIPNGSAVCEKCPLQEKCIAKKKNTVASLPSPKEKKAKKVVFLTVFLLEYQGRFAIEKRPAKGLLASLWQFPLLEGFLTEKEMEKSSLFPSGTEIKKTTFLYNATHIFTHVKWEMKCYHLLLSAPLASSRFKWVRKKELEKEYPIPSAFRKMKNSACNSGKESVY